VSQTVSRPPLTLDIELMSRLANVSFLNVSFLVDFVVFILEYLLFLVLKPLLLSF